PSKRYFLHYKLAEKLFFCPDLAFEMLANGGCRAFFVEYETGSDTPARVAAKKHKGVAGFDKAELLGQRFPIADDFRVLACCPSAGWRDALRKELDVLPGAKHWLFCVTSD